MKKGLFVPVLVVLILLCVLSSCTPNVDSANEHKDKTVLLCNSVNAKGTPDENVILSFLNSVNDNTWENNDNISQVFRKSMDVARKCEDDELEYKGIDNIVSFENLNFICQPDDVYNYADYAQDIKNPKYYFVSADVTVKKNDGFNFNGKNYYVMICGDENGQRVVCDMRLPLPDTVRGCLSDDEEIGTYMLDRFGEMAVIVEQNTRDYNHNDDPCDYANCGLMSPETIKVKRFHVEESEDARVDNVDFREYVNVTVCSEFCFEDDFFATEVPLITPTKKAEFYKAFAIVCRNFAWHRYYSAGATSNFHIYDCSGSDEHEHPDIDGSGPADQSYYPQHHPYPTHVHRIIQEAVMETWTTKLSNENQMLFLPRHCNSLESCYHLGVFVQRKAIRLAEDNKSYRYILHYFYDVASSYPVGEGGDVLINELGDADLNGVINTADATRIMKYTAGLIVPTSLQISVSDYNGDGIVNTGDATLLLRILSIPDTHDTQVVFDTKEFLKSIEDSVVNMEYVPYNDTPPVMADETIDTQDNSWTYVMFDADENGIDDRISYLNLNKEDIKYPTGRSVTYARLMIEFDYGLNTDKEPVYIHRLCTEGRYSDDYPLHPKIFCDRTEDGTLIFVHGMVHERTGLDRVTPFIYKDGKIKDLNLKGYDYTYPKNEIFPGNCYSDDVSERLFAITWESHTKFMYRANITGEEFHAEITTNQANGLYNRSYGMGCNHNLVYDEKTHTMTCFGYIYIGDELRVADFQVTIKYENGEFVYTDCVVEPCDRIY